MALADDLMPDEVELAAMVRSAYLPPLLTALAQATGDLSLLRDDLRPDPARLREAQGGLSREQRAAARELAVAAIGRLMGRVPPPPPDTDALRQLMAFTVGEAVSDEYLPLLREEVGVTDEDLRAPTWRMRDLDPDRDLRVAIVGAGMSGLLAAHRLQQAGVTYVVIEKNDDVGGTWHDNHYPGCRVDVPNHLYSYSFAQRDDWPHRFSSQPVLLDYFRSCADELGLRPNIRFGTEVVGAEFADDEGSWRLTLRTSDGSTETLVVNALVSAVGQLNRPKLPAIAGRELFAGASFHSAEWDPSVDLTGKRVAVVGTAASAIQLIPLVAAEAADLVVFQRTPNWFMPTPEYHDAMPDGMAWLLRHVPFYGQWYRFSLFWRLAEGALPAARVDPNWRGDGRSVSGLNDLLRVLLTGYLETEFSGRPDLLAEVIPDYPPLAKRILLDNGSWARALKQDNVHLLTAGIDRIDAAGIATTDGRHHDVDVIIYATGFEASSFLSPMRIRGRDGVDLHDLWGDDARAYLGITVPGFPNLFCMYGPNTNLVANGSIIFFSECEVNYILGCLRLIVEGGHRAIDCRQQVHDEYNILIDEGNARMVWGASTVNTWYRNAAGRVTQCWPFTLLEFWQRTRSPDLSDFELL